ncbi:MAG: radical SAM family heme chaperone HemW [Rickettsiales bacterium]|jgi:oxygen-independent coproporphyrinogen-3 oxidase|nr:radical SAM family heme chaperone HemW [Rickettsiales bacterium]
MDYNLYFHVPFCAGKCNYCAFYSKPCQNPDWNGYLAGILGEIDYWREKLGRISIPTIFFGGGTPSMLPAAAVEKIIESVAKSFGITANCEISLESNPGTMDKIKLAEFKSIGMNRLSVGVQSLKDEELAFMGRIHNARQALRLLTDARDLGLLTCADFIYGLPGQSAADVERLCGRINELELEHCSLYELSIEPGTPFAKMNLQMPDNETMAEMYDIIGAALRLARYEVSNYASPAQECRHNQNIWDGRPYLGIGDGAAGRVLIDSQWFETKVQSSKLNIQLLSNKSRAVEMLMTGLRTTRGVLLTPDIREIINWDFVRKNKSLFNIMPSLSRLAVNNFLTLDSLLLNLLK